MRCVTFIFLYGLPPKPRAAINFIQYATQITYQIERKINQRKLLAMNCLDLIYRIRF